MAEKVTLDPLLPAKDVHQFPIPTWIENLAVRSNGQLLLTLLTTPELFLVDPSNPSEPVLVHSFPEVLGLTGIVEVSHDIFYVAGGNFSLTTFSSEAGSYKVWEVDMTTFSKDSKASIKKVADIPGSGLLNGMELLSKSAGVVLIADSAVGGVFQVDVKTGKNDILIEVDEMKTPPPPGMPLGINGIKIRDGYLYWTNTGRQLFCRIKIESDGKVAGKTEVLLRDCIGDDFVFDSKGNAWIAQNVLNTVGVLKVGGDFVVAAGKGDQLTVAGGTACQFGRTSRDAHILYVATTGGIGEPINGSLAEGGKVAAIDTSKF